MNTLIAKGAEAELYHLDWHLKKVRVSKGYRVKEIDDKIRRIRTRSEMKLLEMASSFINVPKVLSHNDKEMTIDMEFVEGKKLSDVLDKIKDRENICFAIGEQVVKLHNNNIIHGDLTTSNMILKDDKVYFVDFGLGFVSIKFEDKAVDLYLLKQALESKHYLNFEDSFKNVLKGYKKDNKDFDRIMERLNKVESRGRYKKRN